MIKIIVMVTIQMNWEGTEGARERNSARGTLWNTGGGAGGGNIWRLDGQGKNQSKKLPNNLDLDDNVIIFQTKVKVLQNNCYVQAFAGELKHLSGKQATVRPSSRSLQVQHICSIIAQFTSSPQSEITTA